jgi:hypothetical protein
VKPYSLARYGQHERLIDIEQKMHSVPDAGVLSLAD